MFDHLIVKVDRAQEVQPFRQQVRRRRQQAGVRERRQITPKRRSISLQRRRRIEVDIDRRISTDRILSRRIRSLPPSRIGCLESRARTSIDSRCLPISEAPATEVYQISTTTRPATAASDTIEPIRR